MKPANVALVIGLAMLSTAGCGSVGNAGTDESGSAPTSSSPASPHLGSACLTTRTTGAATVMVDWVDFVQLNGTQYLAGPDGNVPAVASDELGSTVGMVRCQLSALKFKAQPGPAVDGDAAFIAVGTEVHAIRGYAPSCRLTARIGGVNRVYVALADVAGVSKPLSCATQP